MVFKKKRCLVIGSSGFIGENLIPKLTKKYGVTRYDRKEGNDIFSSDLEKHIKEVDYVFHLAAQVSVNKSYLNSGETHRTNVLGTARVVELCEKYNKKLIYPSSAAVEHPDSSPYAHSKWLAEEIVKVATCPFVILRLFNVFGKGMNPDSGSIMYNFLTNSKIVIYGDGEQTRDYININDVTDIMMDSVKKKWDGKLVEVGTGEAYSANYVAGLFAHYQGKKIYYDKPRREIKWSVAKVEQLKALYNEGITTNLEYDVKELVKEQM